MVVVIVVMVVVIVVRGSSSACAAELFSLASYDVVHAVGGHLDLQKDMTECSPHDSAPASGVAHSVLCPVGASRRRCPLREQWPRLAYLPVTACPRGPHGHRGALSVLFDRDLGGIRLLLALLGANTAVEVAPCDFNDVLTRACEIQLKAAHNDVSPRYSALRAR